MPYFPTTACFETAEQAEAALRGAGDGWVWKSMVTATGEPELKIFSELPGCRLAWRSGRDSKYVSYLQPEGEELLYAALQRHNVIGMANLLKDELGAPRVWVAEDLCARPWTPAGEDRMRPEKATWQEWFAFLQVAQAMVQGQAPPDRYAASETRRILHTWTKERWPENFRDALRMKGYAWASGVFSL